MSIVVNIIKLLTVGFYIVAAFAPYIDPVALYAEELMLIALILVVIHASEFVAVKKKLLEIEPKFSTALINTLIFGVCYWLPLVKKSS
ncbi:hypothetical protein [Thalassotalea eurytherma]|uniref:DUF1145 domain-containing protein n=1 Tax=Thalassotalea eurytherma TaxID=1144278 RepID=A0ABQ6H0H0_9GAMM|nr:hypothetical protein [Thalassotalea eurytherma]GLX81097.1 hypothetical protein theurythT_05490 [Thalassotalea eurytherma]